MKLESTDLFLVGDGSAQLLQHTGVDAKDISPVTVDPEYFTQNRNSEAFAFVNDTDLYIETKWDLSSPNEYEDIFVQEKKKIYERFNFLVHKSRAYRGKAVRERDLIIDDTDIHVLDYLKTTVTDGFAVASIAQLLAYENMGITQVAFKSQDDCFLCKAFDGLTYYSRSAINLLVSGEYISHPYCRCEFLPVVSQSFYFGPIEKKDLFVSYTYNGIEIENFPVELDKKVLEEKLSRLKDVKKIIFCDLNDVAVKMHGVEDAEDLVVFYDEEVLRVHYSVIGTSTSLDFLEAFLRPAVEKLDAETLQKADRYFLDGKPVVFYNDRYWDSETGQLVE